MDIQPLLSYNTWLSLPIETRRKLTTLFGIPRTGEVIVRVGGMTAQGNIGGEATQDGHSAKDLYAITIPKMQEVLDSKSEDFYQLFKEVVTNLDEILDGPVEPVIEAEPIIPVKKLGRPAKAKHDGKKTD